MIDDESCNWALRDSLAGETQSQSRSSSTLDGTQGDFTSVLSCCVEARLNAINGTLINQSGVFLTYFVICSAVMMLVRMCCQTQSFNASAAVISSIARLHIVCRHKLHLAKIRFLTSPCVPVVEKYTVLPPHAIC